MNPPNDMDRRRFIKTTGLGAAAGLALAQWPWFGLAEEATPEARAKRLVELMDEHRLFERGARRVYRGEHLSAISLTLGGIAAGPIQINGEARRHIWQIFRNYQGMTLPDSFFAVRAGTVERVLQTVGEGSLAPMKALSFSGEYPFGWYRFEEPALPVQVSMEVFSPLIPLNTKDSSIPCAIFNLTAENTGHEPVNVSFLATQQNPIGYRIGTPLNGRSGATYGGNTNRVLRDPNGVVVQLNSTRPKRDPLFGDLALATPDADAKATAQWESGFDFADVAEAGPTPAGKTLDAAIAVPFVLKPGEKRTVTFVLAWHFSNTSFKAETVHAGNMYANWWPDALHVARDVVKRLESLTAQTRLYNETFYKTNLPYWLLDRISSQVAVLSSMTCHWAKDGFFYAFEGCNPKGGCCDGNATHVWGYSQAHARLFPELARSMREEEFANIRPGGWLPLRLCGGGSKHPAFDGTCHEITASLREHQTFNDPAWLAAQWPAIKKATNYIIQRWDRDEDGMLSGPQHAMDGDQGGTSSWLGGTYLCALAAATAMARVQNDTKAADRYEQILKAGKINQDKALFNGEYFIQVPDPVPQQDYLTGCYIDQMLGQWWALQVNLGWLYPPEHVRAAMASLFRYNFHVDFHGFRQIPIKYCADEDAGMVQGCWPRGGEPKPPHRILYTETIMPGFEYTAACLMLQCGLLREGFTVLHAVADRYDGRTRRLPSRGWNDSWGYSGNPFGDDECGKFYARGMAIWSVLVACQGFSYDATTCGIGFAPLWKPDDHASFFTAAEGWGTYSQKSEARGQRSVIEVKTGRLRLKTLSLDCPHQTTTPQGKVTLDGKPVPSTVVMQNGRVMIQLETETMLQAGHVLEVELR